MYPPPPDPLVTFGTWAAGIFFALLLILYIRQQAIKTKRINQRARAATAPMVKQLKQRQAEIDARQEVLRRQRQERKQQRQQVRATAHTAPHTLTDADGDTPFLLCPACHTEVQHAMNRWWERNGRLHQCSKVTANTRRAER